MKIEKSKLIRNREWSEATRMRLAAALGISALVSLTSCTKAPAPGSDFETAPEPSTTSKAIEETPSETATQAKAEPTAATETQESSSSTLSSSSMEEDPGPTAGIPYYDADEMQHPEPQQK